MTAASGRPYPAGVSDTYTSTPIADPAERTRAILWSLVGNLFLLACLWVFRWPPGDILLMFWFENVILWFVTLVTIMTARRPPIERRPFFFAFHYGLFTFVHGIFLGVIVIMLNRGQLSDVTRLAIPAGFLVLRYVMELTQNWFLRGARDRTTPKQAQWAPYPRMLVMHLSTLLAWFLMFFLVLPGFGSDMIRSHPFVQAVGPGVLMVAGLLVIKTLTDIQFASRSITITAH